jgi:undecaprenyl diphosphate synthase
VIERVEAATFQGQTLHLRVALDYSSRDAILRAAGKVNGSKDISRECFARLLAEVDHAGATAPDMDLLIRTGGEKRMSDFLLWECAYAELSFIQKMWPEFTPEDFAAVVKEFRCRERRFGRVPAPANEIVFHESI